MFDRPNRSELLGLARETLLKDVLSHLDGPARQTGLMVASAMAIVEREIDFDGDRRDALPSVLDRFSGLYGQDAVASSDYDFEDRVQLLNGRLARDLRAGRFDGDLTGDMLPLLSELARVRLLRANPEFLETGRFSQPGSG